MSDFSETMTQAGFLPDVVRRRAAETPDRLAYVFLTGALAEQQRLTYGALQQRVDVLSAHLCKMADAGDRALLLYPPGLDFIAAFLACLDAGVIAVPAPVPRRRARERLDALAGDAQPRLILTTGSVAESARGAFLSDLPWMATDVPLPGDGQRHHRAQEIAFLQYTSGSTGAPRGVVITHQNLAHNSTAMGEVFGISERDVILGWLPHYHDMGLVGNLLQPLVAGIPGYLMSPADVMRRPRTWLEAMARFGATISGGPNFIYDVCVRKVVPDSELDLSRWRVAFNGAEPVRARTLDRFSEVFADCGFRRTCFCPCYGLAETTLIASGIQAGAGPRIAEVSQEGLEAHRAHADASAQAVRLVSCGRPLLPVSVIDPETSKEVAPGRIGEIWLSGASIAQGYWNRDDETEAVFKAVSADGSFGPALRTGDLGFMRDGELYVTGRLKDLIIIRGRNIYPHDIEWACAKSHPACHPDGSAAFSVEVDGEERLVVLQEINREVLRDLDAEAVFAAMRQVLAEDFELQPHAIVLLPTRHLPKTSSGKIRRRTCRSLFLEGRLEPVAKEGEGQMAQTPTESSLLREVCQIVAGVLQRPVVRADLRLSQLGLDSLGIFELGNQIESRFGVEIPMDERLLDMTIDELAGLLGEKPVKGVRAPDVVEPLPASDRDLFAKCQGDGGYFGRYRKMGDRYYTQPVLEGAPGPEMAFQGRRMIVWSINNYLGLCEDPRVLDIARTTLEAVGTWSPMGSRMLTGNTERHMALEARLAAYLKKEAAIVFNYGYMGVMGTMAALVGHTDQVIIDSLSHACIVDGAHVAVRGRPFRVFRHNDMNSLEDQLKAASRNRRGGILIVTEGVYGMTGDVAPLPEIIALKKQYDARLFVDDAHGFGVMGASGAGLGEHQGCQDGVDLYFGTFAKSFVGIGGVTAGNAPVIDYIRYNARPSIFAKSLPLIYVETANRCLDIIEAEPQRRERVWAVARSLQEGLRARGFDLGNTQSVITPVYIDAGSEDTALEVMRFMRERQGIFLSAVTYPVVPRGTVLLRMTPTAAHTDEHVALTLKAFEQLKAHLEMQK